MSSTLAKKITTVKPGTLFVGVDLSLDRNMAVILTERAERVARFGFANSREGYDYFYARVTQAQCQQDAPAVLVGMEPTNYFWKLLATDLEHQQQAYRLVNPYTVKKHREGDQLDRSKDDARDAFTVSDLLRTGKFTQTRLQKGGYAELQELARSYARIRKEMTRYRVLLWAAVGQVFPELRQVFRDFTGDTVRAMLRRHACAVQVRQLSQAAFISGVRQDFDGRRMALAKLRQAFALAGTSVGLQEGVAALQLTIQGYLTVFETLLEQFMQVRRTLIAQFRQMPEAPFLLSIPGIGVLNAALILAEIGDPRHFTNGQQWIKLAGTQPVPNSSGRKSASQTPMSHKGRARLRTWLYFACLRLIQTNPIFKDWYLAWQKREHNPLNKMQALGALMNKLLRIVWALIKHQVTFSPAYA
jgi:transposase